MDYRQWPRDSSGPPREEPAGWTASGHEHETSRYGEQHYGYGGAGYGGAGYGDQTYGYPTEPYAAAGHTGDPYATHVYPAVPPEPAPTARPSAPGTPEPAEDPAWGPAVAWTISLFAVPVLLYLLWAATRSGVAPPGCLDASGMPCQSPRDSALDGLVAFLPGLAGALTLAVVTALGLRRIAGNWRPSTVAVAAAVIGGGTATLIASLLG